jgi:hypothetical protein
LKGVGVSTDLIRNKEVRAMKVKLSALMVAQSELPHMGECRYRKASFWHAKKLTIWKTQTP